MAKGHLDEGPNKAFDFHIVAENRKPLKCLLSGEQGLACERGHCGFGVLPRTEQGFLESVRSWIADRHFCFVTLRQWPASAFGRAQQATRELHDCSNQDNCLCPQPCLPPSWLRRKDEAIGARRGRKTCIKGCWPHELRVCYLCQGVLSRASSLG